MGRHEQREQVFKPRGVSCTGGYAGTDRIVPRE